MAKTRKQKEETLGKIEGVLGAVSAVFVGFTGISVTQETHMRRGMKDEGLGYLVAKKTLLRRALKNAGHAEDVLVPGEVAVCYTKDSTASTGSLQADATAPARRVYAAAKEFGVEKIAILGGLFEGRLMDAAQMIEIATIPSLQTLRGMFANIINSPRQRFAIALNEVAKTKTS